jgi:hypothetical protein
LATNFMVSNRLPSPPFGQADFGAWKEPLNCCLDFHAAAVQLSPLDGPMEQNDQPNQLEPIISSGSGTLTERFLDLSQRHIKLKIQSEQLRHEVEFVISLIHRIEPSRNQVTNIVVKRLADALQKFRLDQ